MKLRESLRIKYDEPEQLINTTQAKQISWGITVNFLLIHIAMLILFANNGVRPMAVFNIFSIIFYLLMFPVIQKEHFKTYILASYLEVLLHMSLAAYFTGWENGFQITLIGINLMLFLSDYFGRALGIKRLPSLWLSFLGMAVYIATYVVCHSFAAPYVLPERVTFRLNIAWAVITFFISIMCMQSYVWLASSSQEMLRRQAGIDKLTGLSNRNDMTGYLEKLQGGRGLEGCWVAMMDVDDFKAINDSYGHLCGDSVLKEIAALMNEYNVDARICRWGGEEFLITGFTDGNMEIHLARLDRLRQAVGAYNFRYESHIIHTTITIGVVEYIDGESIAEWIGRADRKLYEGKESGKDRLIF